MMETPVIGTTATLQLIIDRSLIDPHQLSSPSTLHSLGPLSANISVDDVDLRKAELLPGITDTVTNAKKK